MLKPIIAFALLSCILSADMWLGEQWEAGFVEIRDDGSDLFYWMTKSRDNFAKDPLVFWLSGGPGCSSELAVFFENGPWKIQDDLSLKLNAYAWNNNATVVYMDQPVGTGLSHATSVTDYDTNEDQIAKDFYTFLVGFMVKYPEFKERSIFITGESYAGHYVPAISAYVHKQQNKDIVLVGSAIGNGLVDPYNQYPQYPIFAYENKIIGKTTEVLVQAAMTACDALIETGVWPVALEECQLGLTPIIGLPVAPAFNLYDIRLPCSHPPLCYDFGNFDKFLKQTEVVEALNIKDRIGGFKDCNMAVHTGLLGDWMKSLTSSVTYLLENDVQVLVYSGDKDFICNWRGGEKWTNEATWTHSAEFKNATYTDFNGTDGSNYGQFKSVDTLTFLRVYNAGHMVPMDQPEAALSMMNKFFGTWHENRMEKMEMQME